MIEPLAIPAALGIGMTLGLSGGLAPGPMTALVIAQTLRFGFKEGRTIAFAPLMTDAPLMAGSLWMVASAQSHPQVLAVIALLGAVVLFWLAWDIARAAPPSVVDVGEAPQSVRKAILTNLLNPHAWLFWFAIGGPTLAAALAGSWAAAVAFCVGFFGCLCGVKVVLAWGVARTGDVIVGRWWQPVMRFLGAAQVVLPLLLVRDGVQGLGF